MQRGAGVISWWTPTLVGATISGTISFNLWGLESNMSANAGFRVVIDRCDSSGAFISNVVSSNRGVELGTSAAANAWTATPTSTTLSDGDRLRIRVYVTDVGTMGSGFNTQLNFDGNTNAANGDSFISLTETIPARAVGTTLGLVWDTNANVTLQNKFDGGTDGVTITAANSGGASGDAFNTPDSSGTVTFTFDNDHAHSGTLSFKKSTGGTPGSANLSWTTQMGTRTKVWFRFYVYYETLPSVQHRIMYATDGVNLVAGLYLNSTGHLWFVDSSGSDIFTFTGTVPTNQWVRIEGFIVGSATVGQVELKQFNDTDSTTPTESQTSAANKNTSGPLQVYKWGDNSDNANITLWYDDIGLSDQGYLGPVVEVKYVQSKSSGIVSGTTATTVLDSAPTVGNKLMFFVGTRNDLTIATAPNDGAGHTATLDVSNSTQAGIDVYEFDVVSGTGSTWSVVASGSDSISMMSVEVSGQASALDNTPTVASNGSATSLNTPSVTPSQAGDLAIAYVTLDSAITTFGTPTGGFIARETATGGFHGGQLATKGLAGITSAQQAGFSWTGTTAASATLVLVKLAPAGSGAVGKSLQTIWNTRAKLGDTSQLVWNTRAPLGDTLQEIWNTRAALGDTVQALWTTKFALGDASQIVWNTRAKLGDTLQMVWGVRTFVGDPTDFRWSVKALAGDSIQALWSLKFALADASQLIWNVRSALGDAVDARWGVRTFVGDPTDLMWSIRFSIGDASVLRWDTKAALGDVLQAIWNTRARVGDPLDVQWSIRTATADTVQLIWNILESIGTVGDNLALVWNTRAALSDSLALQWGIRTVVVDPTDLRWSVRSLLGDQLQALWNTRAALGDTNVLRWNTRAALGDANTLRWNTRAALFDTSAFQWNTRAAVGDPAALLWAVRSSVGDPIQLIWNVQQLAGIAGDELALVWNVRAALTDTLIVPWSTKTRVNDQSALQWGVRTRLGDQTDLRWALRAAMGDANSLLWNTRARVSDESQLVWGTRTKLGDTVQVLWSVRTASGDSADVRWSVRVQINDQIQIIWDTDEATGLGGRVKVWDGSQWVLKYIMIWNGADWVACPVRVWTGSAWELTPGVV